MKTVSFVDSSLSFAMSVLCAVV